MEVNAYVSSADLAYLGDSVIEVFVREYLAKNPNGEVASRRALGFVTAVAQSRAVEKLLPVFTEEEADVFRRGRNGVHSGIPKSASAAEYRRATGMECVFGYLWLNGRQERARELFSLAYGELISGADGEQPKP